MARFQDISLAFDDIIETPLSRRRKVEEASLLAQQRMAQVGGPFAALAGGIAGSLPGITENIRTTARDAGLSAFQLPGEKLADQLKNINTNTEAGQRQAVALIERIDPGRAEMLREHYREKNAAIAEAELKERIFNFEQQQARNDLAQKAIENRQEQQIIALRTAELAEDVKQNGIENLEDTSMGLAYQTLHDTIAGQNPNDPNLPILKIAADNAGAVDQQTLGRFLDVADTSRGLADTQRNIRTLMANNPDMTEDVAKVIVQRVNDKELTVVPTEDGRIAIVDVLQAAADAQTGAESPGVLTYLNAPEFTLPSYVGETLYSQRAHLTGVGNSMQRGLASTVGQVPLPGVSEMINYFSEAEVAAKQAANNWMFDLIGAARDEIGSRLTNQMITLIQEDLGLAGKLLESVEQWETKARIVDNNLRNSSIAIQNTLDTGAYDQKDLTMLNQQLQAIDKAVQGLGFPSILSDNELRNPQIMETTRPEAIQRTLQGMTTDQIDALPQEIRDIIESKMPDRSQ